MPYLITEACIGCTACKRKCPVNAIRGEKKQLHQINPDLCIECGVCGKICPSAAILDEKKQPTQRIKQNEWVKPVWNYDLCVECRICVLVCPTGAITLAHQNNGDSGIKPSFPILSNSQNCIGCGFCENNCPTAAILMQIPVSLSPVPE